jgi:hypothetical protein
MMALRRSGFDSAANYIRLPYLPLDWNCATTP